VLPFTTTIDVGETYNRRTARAVSTGLYGTFANPRLRGHLNAYFGAPRGGLWDVGTNGCRPIFNNTVLHCIRSTAEFRPANA
jgi:hypothetical protein